MMTAPSLSSRNSPLKMPTVFEQPSQRILGAPRGRRSRDRTLSPKGRKAPSSSKSPCRVAVNQIQTILGKIIDVDADNRGERAFCSSSITMPDFGEESLSRFPTYMLEDDTDDEGGSQEQPKNKLSRPPIIVRAESLDSRPSLPTRRSSENSVGGSPTTGSVLDCSGRQQCGSLADKSPSLPGRRTSSMDKIPCVPGRQCSATSTTSGVSASQREDLLSEQ